MTKGGTLEECNKVGESKNEGTRMTYHPATRAYVTSCGS
jgi:hypothetical protein